MSYTTHARAKEIRVNRGKQSPKIVHPVFFPEIAVSADLLVGTTRVMHSFHLSH